MTKNVTMKRAVKQFKDKATNEVREYPVYYVNVNGVDVRVKAFDTTGYQLLDMVFTGK